MKNEKSFCLLPSAFCLLPSAFCLLPSAFCLLLSAFCLLALSAFVVVMNVVFHSRLPEVHSVANGFSLGSLACPTVMTDSIDCDNCTRSIRAQPAMNEDWLMRGVVQDCQDTLHLLVSGSAGPLQRNIKISQPRRARLGFFAFGQDRKSVV